jgi:hypothetical protein
MIKFLKALFAPSMSAEQAIQAHKQRIEYTNDMVAELNNHMNELYAKQELQRKQARLEELRIEAMFLRYKAGLISDEEFQAFLLE